MEIKILHIISFIAIMQIVLLITFLSFGKFRLKENKFIIITLVCFLLLISSNIFMTAFRLETLYKFSYIAALTNIFSLLIGPMLLFTLQTIVNNNHRPLKEYLFHSLPFTIVLNYTLFKLLLFDSGNLWFSPFRINLSLIILVHSIIYIFLIIKTYIKNRKALSSYQSVHSVFLIIILGFVLIWVVKFNTFVFIDLWKRYQLCPFITSSYSYVAFLVLNILLFIALLKPDLYSLQKNKSGILLPANKREEILNGFKKLLFSDKIYLNPGITLAEIAKMLECPVPYLSNIVNTVYEASFPQLLNKCRIEEAKKLLGYDNNNKILHVAFDVGFNSKSNFNTVFKKSTGMTPVDFRKDLKKTSPNL